MCQASRTPHGRQLLRMGLKSKWQLQKALMDRIITGPIRCLETPLRKRLPRLTVRKQKGSDSFRQVIMVMLVFHWELYLGREEDEKASKLTWFLIWRRDRQLLSAVLWLQKVDTKGRNMFLVKAAAGQRSNLRLLLNKVSQIPPFSMISSSKIKTYRCFLYQSVFS